MRWIRAIPSSYKAHFLCLITLIYLTQGFRSFAWMGISYQIKDKLRLSPPASQVLVSTAFFPWSVKPIFGFVSDFTPNRDRKRLSYLIVSSILSFLPWIALAQMAPSRASYVYLAVLLTTQNIGAAIVDVVVDAMVVEAARANRIDSAEALQPISWFAIAFGGILGSICGGLGLAIFNVEGIFLLFSVFPILQLFACGLLGEEKLGQVAMAIDEGNYDVLEIGSRDLLGINVLDEPPIDVDYYGMLNSFIEEDGYLDTIMLQAFVKERRFSDDSDAVAVMRLPWISDQSEGKRDKVLAPRVEENSEHDRHDDEDWIQIGQNGLEKDELVLKTTSPDIHKEVQHDIFTLDANDLDLIEELDLMEMEELQRHSEQLNAEAQSICEHPEAVEGQRGQQRGMWQELKSTVSDIMKQPAIVQPVLWFLITQLVIPNLSSIVLCCQTDELQVESTSLGASPMISWGGLMLSTFLFNHYLKHVHLRRVQLW
ncbi:hypothetical protein KC19_2G253100 [Ceratodon purpureus]|uniref:Uncharacterized protein n=1 Tax=Ceratodon purpureus TaxID=3225 RepID=A0A8T0J0B7_CERPU|nr:hypothetical protein KC19_2G253100 [Ceratodon purpureus]